MMNNKHIVYLCLGSNLGDSVATLQLAVNNISLLPEVTVSATSSVYLTEPQGVTDQPYFANQVISLTVNAAIKAEQLLTDLLAIEQRMGRVRVTGEQFGPRTIDIDMLLFDDEIISTPALTVPHPRMHERAFVMVPLAEIAPKLLLPCGKNIQDVLLALTYTVTGNTIYQH